MPDEKVCIWMRVGAHVELSKEEAERVFSGDVTPLVDRLDAGNYGIDGETYVPAFVVEEYNAEHNTEFLVADIDFQM